MSTFLFHFLLSIFTFLGTSNHQLTLNFSGLEKAEGHLMIKVSDQEGKIVKKMRVEVENIPAEVNLNLPEGQYAIACFHDENDNKKLDRNFAGLPKEKYGFSNNARGTFGPPDLSDQLFSLKSNTALDIRLK